MLQGAAGTLSLPWMRRGGEQGTVVGMSCGTSKSPLGPPNQLWSCGLLG